MRPKIKFKIDSKKDVSTFFDFLEDAKYDKGRSFEWAILKHYPYFKKFNNKINKKIVEAFVFKYYLKNKKAIEQNIIIYENNWRKIEKDFFKLVYTLFPKQNGLKENILLILLCGACIPGF